MWFDCRLRDGEEASIKYQPIVYLTQEQRKVPPPMIDSGLGGVPREQTMLKGHLPRVMYHQVYKYTQTNTGSYPRMITAGADPPNPISQPQTLSPNRKLYLPTANPIPQPLSYPLTANPIPQQHLRALITIREREGTLASLTPHPIR